MNEVIVTAGRIPILLTNLNRSLILFDSLQIKNSPVNTVQDLLQYAGGVDVQHRGMNGIQADVNIRGGTFEQTLIMINGVKLSDPQTGHHNLNLPLSLESIERIEILKGEGSRIHGPNAFSGAVNFITRKDLVRNINVGISGGQNGYYSGLYRGCYNIENWGNNISVEKIKSDGYKENTEFEVINFSYNSFLTFNPGIINLFFGLNDKDFGANSFYSIQFPLQAEHTKTKFVSLSSELEYNWFSVSPKLYWRRNNDEFVLNKYNPDFYRNLHETNVYGSEIQLTAKWGIGETSLGGEFIEDRIESTNLNNHKRDKKGIFIEHNFNSLEKLNIVISGFAYNYSFIDWQLSPGFDAGYRINDELRVFAALGKAFRIPTYTELYYEDPVSSGNVNLKHEETINYETGLRYKTIPLEINLGFFRKEGKNIIDWVRASVEDKWRAENITESNTNGIEVSVSIRPDILIHNFPLSLIELSYSFIDSDRKTSEYESRYVLDYLKHQLIINISNSFFYDVYFNWLLRYEKRVKFEDYFLTDLNITKAISHIDLYIKATNIFNIPYKDIAGVPLPGRWIIGGLKFSLY
jgi:iron complex outermembrane receptor protein